MSVLAGLSRSFLGLSITDRQRHHHLNLNLITNDKMSPKPANAPPKLLSCVSCRARKVKCNKEFPCGPCTRGGVECVFPARKRNRKPRQTRQTELLDRLAKLEEIVGKVDPVAMTGLEGANSGPPLQPTPTAVVSQAVSRVQQTSPLETASPSTAKDDPTRNYLSADFWTNLCNTVSGLRKAMEQPDSDSEDEMDHTSPESTNPSDHGFSSISGALTFSDLSESPSTLVYPPPEQVLYLMSSYFSNVDVLVKVLHRPTVTSQIQSFVSSGQAHPPSPAQEALFFAIYFAAASSLPNSYCVLHLLAERSALVERLRISAELALAKADYLNSNSLETLQAFIIYLTCLRSHSNARSSWALVALAIRLAQALGLHRDGDGQAFSIFEAEMRRRLWWQLVVLDTRSVEDRGTESIISLDSFNTTMATNIDDDAFGPESNKPLTPAVGPTDATFLLCCCQSSSLLLTAGDTTPRLNTTSPPISSEALRAHIRVLETRFIDSALPSRPASVLAARIARLVVLKLWLTMHYPLRIRQAPLPSSKPFSAQENLRTAVSVLELADMDSQLDHFTWYTKTWVQWHPLAVALAELCMQTEGELVERAWRVVERVYGSWSEQIADSKRG